MRHQSESKYDDQGVNLDSNRVLSLGLGVGVGVWIVWFALHLPGLHLVPALVGPVVILAWVALASLGARWARPGLLGSVLAGLLTSGVSLMAFGSLIVQQPDPSAYAEGEAPLRPAAALLVLGFLVFGAAVGAAGAAIARATKPVPPLAPTPAGDPWLSRLAAVVACSYVPLVVLGGLVTSSESGMAVKGWPDTFGANMFLYPISLMSQPRIFLEHSHRLFGSLAGLATFLLFLRVMLDPAARRQFGVWTTPLFLAVCVQGYLGGQRVVLNNDYLGAIHGAFGQAVLAYAAVLALWMSPGYRSIRSLPGDIVTRPLRMFTTGALHISLMQLLLGALYRHLRRGDNPGAFHVVLTHMVLSFAVVVFAILAGSVLLRFARVHRDQLAGVAGRVRANGIALHALVGLQFVLGWVAFLVIMTGDKRGDVPTADQLGTAQAVPLPELLVGTAHQLNGAAYLVAAMLAWAWGRQIHKAARRASV